MTQPLLEIRGLKKSFAERKMLDVPRLVLEAGNSYVVMGDNGVGKTTLLRILGGLESAEIQECRFEGRPVTLNPYPDWLRREVLYVHQHPYVFNTSIAHNIAYGLMVRGVPRQERQRRVSEAMQWAGVGHLADTPPPRLSGGEKQRVALARAKVLGPRLYLFDEPTASLDVEARRQTIELIQRLCLDNNCVVIACHDHEIINLPHMHKLILSEGHLRSVPALVPRTGEYIL